MAVAFAYIPPGSIGNYDDLVALVASWMNRDDLTPQVPAFIALLEARLNRVLRVPDMEATTTLSVSSERTALPNDFLQMRSLWVDGIPDRPLHAMAAGGVAGTYTGTAGIPTAYHIQGRSLVLAPPPASASNLTLTYWQRIPALGSTMPTNWLLEQHPDVYLYGSLIQAEAYIANDERIGLWKSAHDEALGDLIQHGHRQQYGAGPLVPNTVRQVRNVRC